PANFFDFHRKGLADIGEELTQAKLARYAVSALVDEVLPTRVALSLGRLRREGSGGVNRGPGGGRSAGSDRTGVGPKAASCSVEPTDRSRSSHPRPGPPVRGLGRAGVRGPSNESKRST